MLGEGNPGVRAGRGEPVLGVGGGGGTVTNRKEELETNAYKETERPNRPNLEYSESISLQNWN